MCRICDTKNKPYILLLLCIAMTLFIFSNSIRNSAESNETSGFFLDLLRPVTEALDKIFGTADWNFIIRKGAHFTEFCILGMLVTSLKLSLQAKTNGYCLFYVLSVAVTDELIQSFSDRTSSVRDVLLDFSGAAFGIALILLIYNIRIRRRKGKKNEHKN